MLMMDKKIILQKQADDAIVSVSCLKHIYPDTTEIHMCGLDFVVNRNRKQSHAEARSSQRGILLFSLCARCVSA